MKSLFCIAVTAFLSIQPLSGVNAVEPVPASGNPDSRDRPRIGLVLGGGGARGGAQIGVLRVLEELRVPVDYIAGSSIGAIVGGMYAAGMSPDRMSAEVARIDWNDLFRDAPPRTSLSFRRKEDDWFNYFGIELGVSSRGVQAPAGFLSGQKLSFKLNSLTLHTTDIDEFDDLPVPFRAMATDLNTGEPVAIDRGSLAKAMRASMSISGVINPVEWDGRLLVDGAISDNLPVTTVREMGADIIIAVDVAPRFVAVESGRSSLLEVGIQTLLVLMAENSRRSQELLGEGDFLLAPELEGIELMSFDRMHEAEEGGEIAARQIAAKLSAYSLSDDDYADYLRRHRRELVPPQTPFVVDSLSIVSGERVPESLIRRRLETGPGEALDLDILFDDLKRVYQIGEFDYVGYRFERNSATDHLTIKAQEKAWGPGYLRFGMRIEAVDGAETDFQLLFNYRRAFINRLGAEWLTRLNLGDRHLLDSEFFQPLNRAGWLFLAPRIRFVNDKAVVMAAGGGHDVLDHQKAYGQLDLGFQFSNTAELRLGVRRGSQRIKLRSSPDSWSGSDIGEWVGRLGLDVLDDVGFPTRGGNLFVETRLSRTGIGAAKDFDRLWARGVLVGSVGRTSAALRGEFGTDFSNTLPYGERFRLGGFMRISGLQPGDRSGGALGLASLALYRNMAPLPQILGSAWYLGVTGEAGNVWPTIREASKADVWFGGSVFLGLGTIVGPVYIAYGLAEGGPKTFYVVLGPHSY